MRRIPLPQVRAASLLPLVALCWLPAGCGPDKSAAGAAATTSPKPIVPHDAPQSTPTPAGSPAPASTPTPPVNQVSLDQIPTDLKSDAYHYYGLDYNKPMPIEMTVSNRPTEHFLGAQTITLKAIENGVPVFKIDRTGQLEQFGEQEVKLEKDGIIDSSSTIAKIGPHDMEMPALLTPGASWKTHEEVNQGRTIVDNSEWKVVGMQKVKTPLGEHDALLITSTGTGTVQGEPVRFATKGWFVKDLGAVKQILEMTDAKGQKTEFTMQETK